jgi:hypothetical protein
MPHRVKLSLFVPTLLLALAATARAHPAEPGAGDLALARELFADAAVLEARGDWQSATVKLKRALAIKETPGLHYHLAHCEEQLGAFVAAGRGYERASQLISEGAPAPDVEPLLPAAIRRVESRVAKLELVVPPGVTAAAELDGTTLPPSAVGASVRVDPGRHQLVVRSPGRREFRSELLLAFGEHRTLKIFFNPEAPSSPPPPTPATHSPSLAPVDRERREKKHDERGGFGAREGVLVSEAVVTLAGLGVGIGFAVARGRATERVQSAQRVLSTASDSSCNRESREVVPPACAELDEAIADHHRAAQIETAAFIGAGVAGAALALTWVLWPSSSYRVAMEVHPRARSTLLVAGGSF